MLTIPLLSALAHERLPSDVADRFCSRLEPEGCVLSAARPGEEHAGVLGGEPALPEGVDWPVWEGNGPLSFVASLDCALLSTAGTGLNLPENGSLLFFYFDGQAGDMAYPDDPGTFPGSRTLYLPAGSSSVLPRPTPSPLKPYRQVPLRADPAVGPLMNGHELRDLLDLDPYTKDNDPAYVDEFTDAMWAMWGSTRQHLVGGMPDNVQGEVEYEVADFPPEWDLDDFTPDNPHLDDILAEAGRWQLLLQVNSDDDADMMWGDMGALYWLITSEDLAARRFDRARFSIQFH